MAEQPAGSTPPETPLVNAPETGAISQETSVPEPIERETDITDVVATPNVNTPQANASAPMADTDPAQIPDVISIEGNLESPETGVSPDIEAQADAPVLPNPQSTAPQLPTNEDDLSISTLPAQPQAPAAPLETDFEVTEVAPPDEPADEPVIVAPDLPADDVEAAQDVTPPAAAPEEQPQVVAQEQAADQAPDQAPDRNQEEVQEPRQNANAGGIESVVENGVVVLRPGNTPDTEQDEPVQTSDAEADPDADPDAEQVVIIEDGPALVIHAADAGTVDGKPMMSVVLMDDGQVAEAVTALSTLPFPVTIAIDPTRDGAEAAMRAYRDAGMEVAVISNLPERASASDVAVNFEAAFATLPESVALIDVGEGGLPSDQGALRQAMSALAEDGRGFVSISRGLNTALREAERVDVPSVIVYRDLDGDGQDARVIRRFLDQAAFRTRQESGVVLLARVQPETISALILWGTANRAGQVALVPVSAILNPAE
ncbi:divergent polysaccharide deacetylase family protein [Aestuariibius sp. HNIBRBA575]|uniref:divergent polysaccharide deacetylase family protein n=1 Tax=Aestuariibius sp. HNIBRBA575 TaxID=3233343 RepID=UPI0034A36C8F